MSLPDEKYLEQLEKLYPGCPFPPILMTISSHGYTMGDIARKAQEKGFSDIDAFQIVDLLKGRAPLTQQDNLPTRLLKAFAAVIDRDPVELMQIAANKNSNHFDQSKDFPVPNREAFSNDGGAGIISAVRSHLEGLDRGGDYGGEDLSRKVQKTLWNLAGNHVIHRGARPGRTKVRKYRSSQLDQFEGK